MYAHALVSSPG